MFEIWRILTIQVTMGYSFIVRTNAGTICLCLLGAMFFLFWLGGRLRGKWQIRDLEPRGGIVVIQSALLGLFGFILAFTFNMSGSRYDYIRNVYITESNAIGTAILRANLYSDSVRQEFHGHFKEYLESRISIYNRHSDAEQIRASKIRGNNAADSLWRVAMRQSKEPNMLITTNLMVPALNEMFDTASERDILLRTSIPDLIIYLLLTLALLVSFTAGITATGEFAIRDLIVISCFIIFTALIIYTTLDLGRPLRGLIRASAAEQALSDLRQLLQ